MVTTDAATLYDDVKAEVSAEPRAPEVVIRAVHKRTQASESSIRAAIWRMLRTLELELTANRLLKAADDPSAASKVPAISGRAPQRARAKASRKVARR